MVDRTRPIPSLAFVAPSGTGKTTLLAAVVKELTRRGHCIAALKGTHHEILLDRPGKDSWKLKEAGAAAVGLLGPGTSTFFLGPDMERRVDEREHLAEVLDWFSDCPLFPFDLVLLEGFASVPEPPKLRVIRGDWPADLWEGLPEGVVALAWDAWPKGSPSGERRLPAAPPAGMEGLLECARLPLDPSAVADWIETWMREAGDAMHDAS